MARSFRDPAPITPSASRPGPGALIAALALAAACESGPAAPAPDAAGPAVAGNAIAGRAAFAADCASCHASGDGFDLAYFGMPDTAVVRRALPHVDPEVAVDIAAWVESLDVDGVARDARLFQPGARVLPNDVAFALAAFGEDAWPEAWTSADLRALDPRSLAIAVPLPRWSEEETNLDWMPETPLPESVLGFRGGEPRARLEAYYASRSLPALGEAVFALRAAARSPEGSGPCFRSDPGDRAGDATACFEVDRWISTLLAQHLLRGVDPATLPSRAFDPWWDVGDDARLSLRNGGGIEREVQNWAAWMALAWIFSPDRHPSVYLGNALMRLDLPRHATVTALKAAVERPRGSLAPYLDVRNAAGFAPAAWAPSVTRFGYGLLLERLAAGEAPGGPGGRDPAVDAVEATFARAARHADADERAELAALRDRVLEGLEP